MVSSPGDTNTSGASCGIGDSSACNWPTDDAELRRILTPEQYEIVRRNGTEPPFRNAFWDKHDPGIYVDIVSGEALFASTDKFNSGTGWPSFTRPIDTAALKSVRDASHGMTRVEVRSRRANSHLGHIFEDGPAPTGLRYCINSGALRFVPANRLTAEGYGAYARLFPEIPQDAAPAAAPTAAPTTDTIVFGAGCFWGTEGYFKRVPGVLQTDVGYAGGTTKNPTYEEVCSGSTGHAEVLRIVFDPAKVSLETLLRHFLRMHEPTVRNRQGNDVGTQYRSIVVVRNAAQEESTRAVLRAAQSRYPRPIVTEVQRSETFYPGEEHHQDYLDKHPGDYCHVDLGLATQPLD